MDFSDSGKIDPSYVATEAFTISVVGFKTQSDFSVYVSDSLEHAHRNFPTFRTHFKPTPHYVSVPFSPHQHLVPNGFTAEQGHETNSVVYVPITMRDGHYSNDPHYESEVYNGKDGEAIYGNTVTQLASHVVLLATIFRGHADRFTHVAIVNYEDDCYVVSSDLAVQDFITKTEVVVLVISGHISVKTDYANYRISVTD